MSQLEQLVRDKKFLKMIEHAVEQMEVHCKDCDYCSVEVTWTRATPLFICCRRHSLVSFSITFYAGCACLATSTLQYVLKTSTEDKLVASSVHLSFISRIRLIKEQARSRRSKFQEKQKFSRFFKQTIS